VQGSIWGHGGYLAPDWSADWLHREALSLLNIIKSNGFYLKQICKSKTNNFDKNRIKNRRFKAMQHLL
jgi:nitric oxide reductase large subunit